MTSLPPQGGPSEAAEMLKSDSIHFTVHMQDVIITASRFLKISRLECLTAIEGSSHESQDPVRMNLSNGDGKWKGDFDMQGVLSRDATLTLQPYRASASALFHFGKKLGAITLRGSDVYRMLQEKPDSEKPGRHDHPVPGHKFGLVIGLMVTIASNPTAKEDAATDVRGQRHMSPEITQALFMQPIGPHPVAQVFHAFSKVKELIAIVPPEAGSEDLPRISGGTLETLENALSELSPQDVEPALEKLGAEIDALLQYVLDARNASRVRSENKTVDAILNAAVNALQFIADECKPPSPDGGTTGDPDPEVQIDLNYTLEEFHRRISKLRRNFDEHKNVEFPTAVYTHRVVTPTARASSPSSSRSTPTSSPSVSEAYVEDHASTPTPKNSSIGRPQIFTAEREDELLAKLVFPDPYPPAAIWDHTLLEGTRSKRLSQIYEWMLDVSESQPNVALLLGGPGTGKTSIARHIWMDSKKRQRSDVGLFLTDEYANDPERVWPAVALAIAKIHPAFRASLCRALDSWVGFSLTEIQATLQNIIVGPMNAAAGRFLQRYNSMVVIIDGLDRCYGSWDGGWRELVESCSAWTSSLAPCFKLLVTARPHDVISQVFTQNLAEDKFKRLDLHSGGKRSVDDDEDIQRFLEHELWELAPAKYWTEGVTVPDWPSRQAMSKLVRVCAGSFSWAHEIVKSISVASDQDRDGQLASVVTSGASAKYIDKLYEKLLDSLFPNGFPDHFASIVGAILVFKRPPTPSMLKTFTNADWAPEELCRTLLPILYIDEEDHIELRHPSFAFFITDSKRCRQEIAVNRVRSNGDIALACFRTLQDELKFNICGFESSYTSVEGMDESQITAAISPELTYASQFWADHMQIASAHDPRETEAKTDARALPAKDQRNAEIKAEELSRGQQDTELFKLVKEFLLQNRWLYWLEVMSALDRVGDAPRLLAIAAEWLKSSGDKELSSLAMDASRFVSTFREAIVFSPAHLYLSALPFCPPSSPLYKQLHSHFPNHFSALNHGGGISWLPLRFSFIVDESPPSVHALALSPDGKRVVAGLGDSNVSIFHISTGAPAITVGRDGGSVRAVAFFGKRVIAGSDDGGIRMWDSDTGTQLGETFQAHTDWIRGIAVSPDGTQLVSCSDDNTIRVIDLTTMRSVADPFKGHSDYVRSVAWTPDGLFLVSGSDDRTVRVWDKFSGLTVGNPMAGHRGYVRTVVVDKSAKYIASGGDDDIICLWDLDLQTQIRVLRGHTNNVRALAFSNDGTRLISGSDDYSIIVWDILTGQPIAAPLRSHSYSVTSLCVLPQDLVLSGSEDGSIKTWDISPLSSDTPLPTPDGPGIVTTCIPDGKTVACIDGRRYWHWDLHTGSSTGGSFIDDQPIPDITFLNISPNGEFAAIATSQGARVYHMSTGERLPYLSLGDEATGDVAFSVDGQKLVTVAEDSLTLSVWDVCAGTLLAGPMGGQQGKIAQVAVSPGGKLVASCADDNSVCIWDIDTGTALHGLMEGHTDWASAIAFSPDERYLASAAEDNNVIIWDVQSGKQAFKFSPGYTGRVLALAWPPDCRWVAIGSRDSTIRVFDIRTGQLVVAPFEGHRGTIIGLTFSWDGSQIISGAKDGTVRVWDITPTMLSRNSRWHGDHEDWVHAVAVSPDGSFVASGGDDNNIFLHDVDKLHDVSPRMVLRGHEDWIVCILFTPDGKYLITGSYDGDLRVWDCRAPDVPQISKHQAEGLRALTISPTGHQIAWALADQTINLYDIHGGSELTQVQTLRGHSSVVKALAYFPNDSSQAVSGAQDGTICIWSTSTGEVSTRLDAAHEGSVLAITVTPDGSCIASAGEDHTTRLWDAKTGDALLPPLTGHNGLVHTIHLSPDGSQIISGSRDTTIRIWDRTSGEQLCPPLYGHDGAVLALAVSGDGKLLISGSADNTVALWNVDFNRKMKWPEISEHKMIGGKSVCTVDEQGMVRDPVEIDFDGWATQDGHRLFWVPWSLRKGLCIPPQTGILGTSDLYLDFRNFVHGKEWMRCRKVEEVED